MTKIPYKAIVTSVVASVIASSLIEYYVKHRIAKARLKKEITEAVSKSMSEQGVDVDKAEVGHRVAEIVDERYVDKLMDENGLSRAFASSNGRTFS